MNRLPLIVAAIVSVNFLLQTNLIAQETSRVWFQAERNDYYHPKRIVLRITNPLPVDRIDEPVVVPVVDLKRLDPEFWEANFVIVGPEGWEYPSQVDDLDWDGEYDEIAFQMNLPAGGEAEVEIRYNPGEPRRNHYPSFVNAGLWKTIDGKPQKIFADILPSGVSQSYRMDGPVWESELIGYRQYASAGHSTDIFGKRRRGLYLDYVPQNGIFYIGQNDWGGDVLLVRGSLGLGGIGLWSGEKLVRSENIGERHIKIVASGPVRAIVWIGAVGWDFPGGETHFRSEYTIWAHKWWTEHRARIIGLSKPLELASGIVRHPDVLVEKNGDTGWFYTYGPQAIQTGKALAMAVLFDTDSFVKFASDELNNLAILKPDDQGVVLTHFLARWEDGIDGLPIKAEFQNMLNRLQAELNHPLVVEVVRSEENPKD
jgi:hypothetical protein